MLYTRSISLLFLAAALDAQVRIPGPGGATSAASFTGMGDINTSGVQAAWGLRAYSAASRGNKLINACDASDVHCVDILSDAITGNMIVPSSNPDCTASTCTIKIWYDISGQVNCSGVCDLTRATIASRATLIINCLGTKPCAQTSGGTGLNPAQSATAIGTISQPYTISIVAARTGAFTTQQGMFSPGATFFGGVDFDSTTGTATIYAGSSATATASNTTTHAFQVTFNGASTNFYIDGSANTVSPGTGAAGGSGAVLLMNNTVTTLTGNMFEAAIWSGDQSANNAAMNMNQHSGWGF